MAGDGAKLIHSEPLGGGGAKGRKSDGIELWFSLPGGLVENVLLLRVESPEYEQPTYLPIRARQAEAKGFLRPRQSGVSSQVSVGSLFSVRAGLITFSWRFEEADVPPEIKRHVGRSGFLTKRAARLG